MGLVGESPTFLRADLTFAGEPVVSAQSQKKRKHCEARVWANRPARDRCERGEQTPEVTCLERFLDRTKPRRSEAEQSPANLICTILPGSHLKACRLLKMELDPIERRNVGRRHSADVY